MPNSSNSNYSALFLRVIPMVHTFRMRVGGHPRVSGQGSFILPGPLRSGSVTAVVTSPRRSCRTW